jgi:hypothetical protein
VPWCCVLSEAFCEYEDVSKTESGEHRDVDIIVKECSLLCIILEMFIWYVSILWKDLVILKRRFLWVNIYRSIHR